MEHGMKNVEVYVKGARVPDANLPCALQAAGFNVLMIKDVTPIPHNGCRPAKSGRRV
jgi:small subunit ribosomal protein S11